MKLWPQLLSSALVGTQRRPCRPGEVDGPLATALTSLAAPALPGGGSAGAGSPGGGSPGGGLAGSASAGAGAIRLGELGPEGLLSAAGAVTLARRAGVAAAKVPLPLPAPEETTPPVSTAAGSRLGGLLAETTAAEQRQRRALLREWLDLAARHGLIAPPRYLTALIDLGTADTALRPAVIAVGGARLVWLAALGPGRWAWIGDPAGSVSIPDPDDWQTGRTAARVRYLESVRATDPDRGRVLLGEVWQQERAADLAALIAACAAGLGPQDEPWLEKALDDRRVQIREAAAQLLGALEGSGYRMRMADRVLACCALDAKGRIAVTPPAEFDASMRRDALSQKPPYGMGERAWWLLQIISAAPLDCWSGLDPDPAGLLARKVTDDWAGVLRQGWMRAATVQRDAAWGLQLCRLTAARGAELTELAAVLPVDALAELAADAVRRKDNRMGDLLSATPGPWPAPLAAAVLAWLENSAQSDEPDWWHLITVMERKLDPAAVSAVSDIVSRADEGRHHDGLQRLAATLQTRFEMHQEFA